jgi:hypothetical protein
MFQTKLVAEIKTHATSSISFFENVPFITWENMIDRQATDNNTIRRMRFTCWMTTATTQTRAQNM